nr:MAG TPA: hypothetical protein [Caudoviricetes sp.]
MATSGQYKEEKIMELIVLLFLKFLFACWETKDNGGK